MPSDRSEDAVGFTKPQEVRPVKGIQAIETGFRVLLAIQQGPPPVALKDIAERAQMSPGQAHNYLTSFLRTHMVQSTGRGKYQLGPSLVGLGLHALQVMDRQDLVAAEMVKLRDELRLGVAVAVWADEIGPVFVMNRSGDRELWGPFELRTGVASAMGTGAGNVYLAFLPRERAAVVCQRELAMQGISAADADRRLDLMRRSVQELGYARRSVDEMPGYKSISAPVWDSNDEVVYAVTVTGPERWIQDDGNGPQVERLLETTKMLSRMLQAPQLRWS